MLLYLLRHADADTPASSDSARALSEKGKAQASKVARFCEAHDMQLSLVLSSPVRRAHETAQIVSATLRAELLVAPWMACGMAPQTALEELRAYRSQGSVLIVGHEPDFSSEVGRLTGAKAKLRKGGLAIIDGNTLVALLRPKDLLAIAGR